MAWSGYFHYGGTEVLNATRTEAYARHMNLSWFKPVYNETSLPWLLGEDEYTTPLQDDAPWTDPEALDSYDFYGVYPLEVTGFEDSTVAGNVTESVIDGGYVGRIRRTTRSVVFSAVLVGASECAVEYGQRWLRSVLNGGACFGAVYGNCGGADLCYLACPPVFGEVSPTYSKGPVSLDGTNRAEAPNMEDGQAAGWLSADPATFTVGFTSTSPISGTGSAMSTRLAANPGVNVAICILYRRTGEVYAVQEGVPITYGVDVRVEQNGRNALGYFLWYDSAITSLGNSAPTLLVNDMQAGETHRMVCTATPPAGAAYCIPVPLVNTNTGQNAPTGERVWFDNLYLGTDPTGAYFDGSTKAKGDYSYRWTGAPNISASERMVQTYVQDPLPTAEDCYQQVGRALHDVSTTTGPVVTQKMTLTDGGTAWTVTWTMVAANPAEFGMERPLVQGFLDPEVDIPYVGGVLPPGASFDPDGFVQDDPSCPVTSFQPVYDPACGLLSPPPDVPSVVPMCFSFPVNYLRRSFTIPTETIPLWTEVAPVVSLHTGNSEARSVRLRFYADTFGTGNPDSDPCNFCGDVVFSYIPPSSTIVLDCADHLVYIDSPGLGRRRADTLVSDSDGNPFEWPQFSCGFGYVVTVDTPQQAGATPVIDLALVPRVA